MVIKVFRIPIAFNFSQIVVKSHRFKFQVKFLNFINNKLRIFIIIIFKAFLVIFLVFIIQGIILFLTVIIISITITIIILNFFIN